MGHVPNVGCTNQDIEHYYVNIVTAIKRDENETLPHKKFIRHLNPYWSKHVKDLHRSITVKREVWISEGRPRGEHRALREYKCAKRHFRCELRNAYQTYMENDFDIDQKKL